MIHYNKKLYPAPYFRNQTSNDCHLWYKMCKIIICLGVFFSFFQNFDFLILRGVKEQKWPKLTKNSACNTPYLKKHTTYDHDFWYTCKMMISAANYFILTKFWFYWFLWGKRAKNDPKLPISICRITYLRNCRSYHQDFWYTGVK